ncbi:WD40 repeat domain-containing serine/threonine protein kinase [Nonomuraea sp. NBC_01738]|uniref:WD40 repeat domain-containing serine/threonine protein kinase n=1 Tax=Nonomuraea sp. NBC_01738 TaxID=2976003 RepID=UPI002E135A5C|nr:WD40 repeat domain-containing serine/threonine protein kinase [Nonomuraea sp. NBC_01738]
MPSFAPLRTGDPERLGAFRIIGRLGEGGQGVVYLATDQTGANVAIKWLRAELAGDEVSKERFMREVQVAERVAPFCTAAVLTQGIEHERPYIVSEYIDGLSLHRVVDEQGPRAGSALHRLAIGTATALAAIHQAGIVHRDFKPANVLLGADGPRVIDFGIARALDTSSSLTSMAVGTPSYMPPEQFMGHPVGPATDMFSWGATMVYAASGRAPFGSDTMPAVINRVLNQPPDLGALDGALREIVAACLSKDPGMRPTADQVIMRLLQHPVSSGAAVLAQGAAAAGPAQPSWGGAPQHSWAPPVQHSRSKAPVLIAVSVTCALLLVAGVALVIPWSKIANGGTSTTTISPEAAVDTAKPSTTPPTTAPPRTSAVVRQRKLPGGAASVFESATDPITLTAYEIYNKSKKEWVDYAREGRTGSFQHYPDNEESILSPDGRYLATRGKDYTSDSRDYLIITNRATGGTTTIKTVKDPEVSSISAWSRDSERILLNLEKKVSGKWQLLGFAILNVKTEKVEMVRVNDSAIRGSDFAWDGDEQGVVAVPGKSGLRFFDAKGAKVRDAPEVGELPSGTQDIFSHDGTRFFTNCPGGDDGDHCIWDAGTGKEVERFSSDCDKVLGWYDSTHLFCWEQDNSRLDEVQVLGFNGKLTRKLLEISDGLDFSPTFTVNPSGGS